MADCIEPRVGEWIVGLANESAQQSVERFTFDPAAISEARIHWTACPACREQYPSAGSAIARVTAGVQDVAREWLTDLSERMLLSAEQTGSEALPLERITSHLMLSDDVRWALSFIYGEYASFAVADERDWGAERVPLGRCKGVLELLAPEVQTFVFENTAWDELLSDQLRRLQAQTSPNRLIPTGDGQFRIEENHFVPDDAETFIADGIKTAILDSGINLVALERIVHAMAIARQVKGLGSASTTDAMSDRVRHERSQRRPSAISATTPDVRHRFASIEDALDSLKAGQMEMMRLIDRSSRRADSFAEAVESRLGGGLYSSLGDTTKRSLHRVEYLYAIANEPDCYIAHAMALAQAYEAELMLRVIWPFVTSLTVQGVQDYDANGLSDKPLLRHGKMPHYSYTIGTFAWYLASDDALRSFTSGAGLDADALVTDARFVTGIRNKAAHEPVFDASLADKLRDRMMRPDGLLSRLHPAAKAASGA